MYLIHGTWIPDETTEFIQGGAFYLWVETDTPTENANGPGELPAHPRHLSQNALAAFLADQLGIRVAAAASAFRSLYFLLPSTAGQPLPSPELWPDVAENRPDDLSLAPWLVCGYPVPHVIATLNDLDYIALHTPDGFRLGADLLFWHQLTRLLKQIIAKDQYIPALISRELPAVGRKRSKAASGFDLRAGWQIISATYETALPDYLAAMPVVSRAGSLTPASSGLYEPESLVRHFVECTLHQAITETAWTAKHEAQFSGSLLSHCIAPRIGAAQGFDPEASIEEYRQWAVWREKLTRTQTMTGFTLGFRLDEPPTANDDGWTVRFLAVATHDPSLKLALADYWQLAPAARAGLESHFGADFVKHLLVALGQAARIYPKIWEGLDTAEPSGIRLSLDDAYEFLRESAWVLEDAGFTVLVPSWWTPAGRRRAKVRLKTSTRAGKAAPAATGGYFGFDSLVAHQYQLMIGDEIVSEEEWQQLVAAKTPLVQFRGHWMELDRDKMQQLLEFWKKRQPTELELSLPDLLKLATESADDLEWDHDALLRDTLARLEDKSTLTPIEDLPELRGTLRDYQKRGVAWLAYLERLGLNPCLADDMGLGKTLEVIAHLVRERTEVEKTPPTLVIAPTSVLSNWRKEIERFAPHLRAVIHHGADRPKDERAFQAAYRESEVVITSFALARLDDKLLRSFSWHRIVVDEAQNIKNPEAAQTRAISKLSARHRLALTGTPVENRLLDLWSIFNFLNPGYLGKPAQFRKTFELPIQKEADQARATTLKRLVEPFILRRVKTDRRIIADLPDKVEQKLFCSLTPEQASLYAAVVKDAEEQLDQADGIQRRGLILATLTKLKQVCNHPAQFLQDGSAFTAERSQKLQRLREMIEEAIEAGESVLVFTQFAEVGHALEEHLARTLRCVTYYLHGGTSLARREKMVASFQDPESGPAVFILSLRAGGVGLNLTRANHVFHFDRWWNPAVESQATDRAYRIGQQRNVFVHAFVAIGTVEERIDQMIEDKKQVASTIVGTDEAWLTELDNESFKELIALRRDAVLE